MPRAQRIIEVDALRGIAILGMLAVNVATPALRQAVPQVEHAAWNGFRLADLVFPAFLFVVGCAMTIGPSPSTSRILRRVALLFVLGLALGALDGRSLETFRVMGVLQRIALAYGVAALVMRRGGTSTWAVGAAVLAGVHWALLAWPVGGASSLVQGGGVAAALDRVVLGSSHSYLGAVPDPEGLLGTLTAAASILCGAVAMRLTELRRAPLVLALAGALAVAAGLGWATVLPLNKSLWTGSYALYTAGLTGLVLAGLLALRPLRLQPVLTPAAVLGRNALAVYVVTEAVRRLARRPSGGGGSVLQRAESTLETLSGSAVGAGWLLVALTVVLALTLASTLAWRNITVRV